MVIVKLKKYYRIIIVALLLLLTVPIVFFSSVIVVDYFVHPDEIPSFFGWKPFIVLTESMEDEIMAGDVAVVQEVDNTSKLKQGDVVAFRLEKNSAVIHRIYDVVEENGKLYYITKGDANATADAWKVYPDEIEGIYQYRIKGLGKVFMFLQSSKGILICMTIPVAVLFIIQLIENIRNNKEREQTEDELLDKIEELENEKKKLLEKKRKKTLAKKSKE